MDYSVRKSTEYDGKLRTLFHLFCYNCKKDFYVPAHIIKKSKYCSRDCADIGRRKQELLICTYCNKTFKRARNKVKTKSGTHFCSRTCKDEGQALSGGILEIQPKHYGNGITNYRLRAFRKYGKICVQCSYDKFEQMLDVDHIDGNRENNKLENLQVLCVWCHTLKTRNIKSHKRI